jgi:hypothetical protein
VASLVEWSEGVNSMEETATLFVKPLNHNEKPSKQTAEPQI